MSKNISREDLRKRDFLVLKQSRDDTVTRVVAPNGLQIGLSDEKFKKPLTIKFLFYLLNMKFKNPSNAYMKITTVKINFIKSIILPSTKKIV